MQVEDFAFMGLGFEVCMPKGSFEVAPLPPNILQKDSADAKATKGV